MGFRQLRYVVTLAEELHSGRAAARQDMVQSALSQQLQRLERELGMLLLDRTPHHVELTPSGSAFLLEARQIPAQVNREVPERFRLDPLGVLVPEGDHLAASREVPVAKPAAQLAACRGVVGAG